MHNKLFVGALLVSGLYSASSYSQIPAPQSAPGSQSPSSAPSGPAQPAAPTTPAQATAVPPGSPPPPTSVDSLANLWRNNYNNARELLLKGDFDRASTAFEALARGAPDPVSYAVAVENWRLATHWKKRELTLVRRADLGESSIHAKAANERTSDEIVSLYSNAVFYGIGTGTYVSYLADANSAAGYILPSLGLAGASAGAVALLDSSGPFKYGVPQSIVTGMYLGLNEGITLAFWNQARARREDEWGGRTVATVIWGFSTAGALSGGIIGNSVGTTPGRASFVGSAGLWAGTIAGLTVGAFSADGDRRDDNALLSAAIGLNVGIVGGALGAGSASPTIARVRYIDLGGISGALLFGGLLFAADDNPSASSAMGAVAIGSVLGLSTAWIATGGMPKDMIGTEATQTTLSSLRFTLIPSPHGGASFGVHGSL